MIVVYVVLLVLIFSIIYLLPQTSKIKNYKPSIQELSESNIDKSSHHEIVATRKIQIERYGKQQKYTWIGFIISLTLSFLLIFSLIGWITFKQVVSVKDWPTILPLIAGLTLTAGFRYLYSRTTKEYNSALESLQELAFKE